MSKTNHTLDYDYLRSLILPLKEIDYYTPKFGRIVELGCGEGVIAKYLARNKKRKILGVDIDKSRLPKIKTENLSFKRADITKIRLERVDGIILSDVLHHLSHDEQKKLLRKISNFIKKGGILLIKEIDTKEVLRSKLSRVWDFILYPKDKIFFSNSDSLEKLLNRLNFGVTILRPCRLFPGSTTLYICRK